MAFPTTGILDSGVRANEDPLSDAGKWTNPAQSGNSNLKILSNQIVSTQDVSNVDANAYRSNTTYGPDSEVYVTMATRPNRLTYLYSRLQSPGQAGIDGYFCLVNIETTTENKIQRIDNGAFTLLGAAISQTWSNGDSVGLEVVGTTITMYRKTGGSWSSLANRTDSTYGLAGNIGMGDKADATAGAYVDFGGGTISGAAATPRRMLIGVGT